MAGRQVKPREGRDAKVSSEEGEGVLSGNEGQEAMGAQLRFRGLLGQLINSLAADGLSFLGVHVLHMYHLAGIFTTT